jgi:hypothetical protein
MLCYIESFRRGFTNRVASYIYPACRWIFHGDPCLQTSVTVTPDQPVLMFPVARCFFNAQQSEAGLVFLMHNRVRLVPEATFVACGMVLFQVLKFCMVSFCSIPEVFQVVRI